MSSWSFPVRLVFSSHLYIALAATIAVAFWVFFNLFDQLLFFSPTVTFYLPADAVDGFVLSTITSVLLGIVISMNVYLVKNSRLRIGGSLLSGSSLGMLSSACASCSSLGFTLVSAFGGAGAAVSAILTVYQVPLRLASIGLLVWAYYSVHSKLRNECKIDKNPEV
jgi:hypothetical protein